MIRLRKNVFGIEATVDVKELIELRQDTPTLAESLDLITETIKKGLARCAKNIGDCDEVVIKKDGSMHTKELPVTPEKPEPDGVD